MTDNQRPSPSDSQAPVHSLPQALAAHLQCLQDAPVDATPLTEEKVAQALSILVEVLKKIDATLLSQLEVLGKSHPRIKSMVETLQAQGLLNIEASLQGVLASDATRMTRLSNYTDLLTRWWAALMAGLQAAVLELPNELTESLNPSSWEVEKKRWSSEEEAFWQHFSIIVRHEVPLKISDKMKKIQAEKTLDAYAILGSGERTTK